MAEKDPWDFSAYGGEAEPETARRRDPIAAGHDPYEPSVSGRGDGPVPNVLDDLGGPGSDLPPAELSVARPPLRWLGISAGLSAVGLALAALLGGLPPLAVIGWALCGPLAIGALGVYTSSDTRRRAHPVYIAPNWLQAGYIGCLLLCLAGVIISALRIGLWVGRW